MVGSSPMAGSSSESEEEKWDGWDESSSNASQELEPWVKVKDLRLFNSSGFTPSRRGDWARFKFRQLASSPSWTRKETTDTPFMSFSSKPKNSRPALVFRSCTIGSDDSPRNAKPPVPEERRVLSRVASILLASTAAMRKAPLASKATMARLRWR